MMFWDLQYTSEKSKGNNAQNSTQFCFCYHLYGFQLLSITSLSEAVLQASHLSAADEDLY